LQHQCAFHPCHTSTPAPETLLGPPPHRQVCYTVTVQLLEIYNEVVRDLLAPAADATSAQGLQRSLSINATQRSGGNVPDATRVPVACPDDVLRVLRLGARNRAVAETRMNERSSRSHQGECARGRGACVGLGGLEGALWKG
jgi:hypothetical protein